MKCSQCGFECKRGVSFCSMCGSPLPKKQALSPKMPSKKVLRRISICTCIIVAVILLVLYAPFLLRQTTSSDGFMLFKTEADSTGIVYNNHLLEDTIPAVIQSPQFNLDQTVGVATTSYSISFISPKDVTTTNTSTGCYAIAPAGNAVAYVNAENQLILWDVANRTETEIATADKIDMLVISPDGCSLAYRAVQKELSYLAVYTNGTILKNVLVDCVPIGISDNADMLYCYNEANDALLVSHNCEDPILLASAPGGSYRFNQDHTQILFNAGANRTWYVSEEGAQPHKIATNAEDLTPLLPQSISSVTDVAKTYNIKTFANQFYYSADRYSVYRVSNNWASECVAANGITSAICTDAQTVYCSNDQTLYMIKGRRNKPVTGENIPSAMISSYVATANGKELFYLTEDNCLYYAKKGGQPKQIASQISQIFMSHDDQLLYQGLDESGDSVLFCLKNNSNPVQICGNYVSVSVGPKVTCYTSAEGLFCATKSPKFKLLGESFGAYIPPLS